VVALATQEKLPPTRPVDRIGDGRENDWWLRRLLLRRLVSGGKCGNGAARRDQNVHPLPDQISGVRTKSAVIIISMFRYHRDVRGQEPAELG